MSYPVYCCVFIIFSVFNVSDGVSLHLVNARKMGST